MDKARNRNYGIDPHSENSHAILHFERIDSENGNVEMFKCKICDQVRNGAKRSNLVSHLKFMHKGLYHSKIKKKVESREMSMEIERLKLLQSCVELTTINKQPFANLMHSGFQTIVSSKLEELREAGYPLNFQSVIVYFSQ